MWRRLRCCVRHNVELCCRTPAERTARRFPLQESKGEYTPKVGPMQKAGGACLHFCTACGRALGPTGENPQRSARQAPPILRSVTLEFSRRTAVPGPGRHPTPEGLEKAIIAMQSTLEPSAIPRRGRWQSWAISISDDVNRGKAICSHSFFLIRLPFSSTKESAAHSGKACDTRSYSIFAFAVCFSDA